MNTLREDAFQIIQESINSVMPDAAVEAALLENRDMLFAVKGKLVVIAIGKAAYTMAEKASEVLGDRIDRGLVVTKYDHLKGSLIGFELMEAGHPILDENSIKAGQRAVEMVEDLTSEDMVLFLISGGGSAVFEKPVEGVSLQDITIVSDQLLASGASISEINTIRKHLSDVKGGRFAMHCKETPIFAVALSDVLGNSFDTIASGPVHADTSTSEMALDVVNKYQLFIGEHVREALKRETPKQIYNVSSYLAGSVKELCESAALTAKKLGYEPLILTTSIDCEARDAGRFMASLARELKSENMSPLYPKGPCALILGGETVVTVKGHGMGGRSQELALSASLGIEGLEDITIFAVGSDGTDGPTDAAGGIVDGQSAAMMREEGIDPQVYLDNNDSYKALYTSGDLIVTGPTGTNVNDLMIVLCR